MTVRRFQGAALALACAVGAVFLTGAGTIVQTRACSETIAVSPARGGIGGCGWRPSPGRPPARQPLDRHPSTSGHAQLTAAELPLGPPADFVATATRHIDPSERPALSAGDRDTDRAMVLVVGWTMLVLLGGGFLAGGSPGEERAHRAPARRSRHGKHRAGDAAGPLRVRYYLQPETTPVERFLSK
jgi:hypothetical protein